ncbi:MAG TPA: hypothetical protein VG844_10200 [Terracidiphilus sp.]|nr:hypothetical protein [Terracidiphilus sp.]
MNGESSKHSYRAALDAASADIAEIRAQIDQLTAVKNRIEKAAEALRSIVTMQENSPALVVEQPAQAASAENGESSRPVSKPLFSSSYQPIPKFNETPVPAAQDSGLRSLAAYA